MSKAKRRGIEIRGYLKKIDGYEETILSEGNLSKDDLVALLNKDANLIHAREFYYAVKNAGGDLNIACGEVFINLRQPDYKKAIGTDPEKTRLENFIEQFIVLRQDIAVKIDTDPSTFSRYLSAEREIFAYQIYFLAKAHGKSASEVFEFLYGPDGIGKI